MISRETLKNIGVNICRFVVALTFVFSGYVKAIDPTGTQYKMHDYLAALGMETLLPDYALVVAAMVLAAVELCMGVFLLFAIRRRLVSKLALLFMSVMTLITVWVALANPVADCGCFGDALKLTNWQTLGKNLLLLAATVAICSKPTAMVRFIGRSNQWIVINYTFIYSVATSTYCMLYLPTFDFRPYHIGADIRKGMEIPPGAEQPKFETIFVLEKDGQRKEFSLDNYPDSTWTFIDSKTTQVSEGYVPPIHDFSMEDTKMGVDMTDSVLTDTSYTFLLVAPHLENADDSYFGDINQIYDYCKARGYRFYALTASGEKAISHWIDITGAEYPFLFTDETTLKTMIRSNPGLLLLKGGVVMRKWSHNDLPKLDAASASLNKIEEGRLPDTSAGEKLAYTLLWFFMPLLLLALADRTWAWTRWVRRKKAVKEEAGADSPQTNKEE